jgi:tetratricopeptide (TPR) repeat protein
MRLTQAITLSALVCALGVLAPTAQAQMGGGSVESSGAAFPTEAYNAGVDALNAGNFAEAIRQLNAARRAAPTDGNINYVLGLAYIGSNEKEQAKGALERAVRDRDAPFQARLRLGLLSLELGDRETAVEQQTALQRLVDRCSGRNCDDARRAQMQAALDQLTRALAPA